MRVIRIALVLAVFCAAACAPKANGETHAVAKALLDRAGISTPFVDASTDAYAAIVHGPSGMLCKPPRNGAFDFGTFPAGSANEGAYCATADNGVVFTLMAVRYRTETTLDRVFADALATGASQAAPRTWSGPPSPDDVAGPGVRVARFEGVVDGRPSYLRVAMAQSRGWYLQQFASAPIELAAAAEAQAGVRWKEALTAFTAAGGPPAGDRKE